MINLLDLRNEQINDESINIVISKNIEDSYKLDLSNCKENTIVINLLENVNATILNVIANKNKKITINIANGASLNLNIASFEENDGNSFEVILNENSEFDGAYADFSLGKNHFDFVCNLNGRGAKALWHLATLSKDNDKKEFDISFYHYNKDTYARMENYGVCENESLLTFSGTSKIFKGAKRSATHQSAKVMVFDKKCNAKASPILCIDENDVQASHAAVVGQINDEHIFYLTSRGIEEKEAKKLITLGYLVPILNHFKDQETKDIIALNIEKRV